MMDMQKIIFMIAQCAPGFLLAITFHEYAHARVAKMFGDDTAEREGRMSLNPLVHIDPMGTIVFPLVLVAMNWGAFGWAKPVPVVPRNFTDMRRGVFWVSFAGPLSNFILGTGSALAYAIFVVYVPQTFSLYVPISKMIAFSITINFILGAFNMIPFPPLDGSRVLATYLNGETLRKYENLGQYTNHVFLGLIVLSFMGIQTLSYVIMPFVYFGNIAANFFIMILS